MKKAKTGTVIACTFFGFAILAAVYAAWSPNSVQENLEGSVESCQVTAYSRSSRAYTCQVRLDPPRSTVTASAFSNASGRVTVSYMRDALSGHASYMIVGSP
ncbi:hypothetical protein [Rhodanobacter sp. C01]|uniref:hypothetical protein n=1 Tax=Rhodanobacter sp. C01 TaxID=1945856 RepID=UPI000985489D|nr:hypothetical protein [Rhodanobacter sp. C01]OOG45545.1 hypothetical protein B0E50_15180 [Rhodanobacter sp. C01]